MHSLDCIINELKDKGFAVMPVSDQRSQSLCSYLKNEEKLKKKKDDISGFYPVTIKDHLKSFVNLDISKLITSYRLQKFIKLNLITIPNWTKYEENYLLKNGYKTDFHKEHILSNTKLQIDLFLPTMNIAIEVDGPSHFLPVWGDDVLLKNQKYDKKKTGLIIGKGLSLIRIKQTRDFSKSRADLIVIKLLAAIESVKNNNRPHEI
jgi:very-short-patch-repair endonuclease